MENYSFKTVAFGGFDKQDVVHYLEQSAEKSAALQRQQEQENERLRQQNEELTARVEALQKQVEELSAQREELREQVDTETSAQRSLRALEGDVARLTAEADRLRPDAEAYARFRMRLGDIECEARNRAEDLEEAAAAQTRRTAETFQTQYRRLMETFSAASVQVTRELQALQEALDRLPRGMDDTEAELNRLTDCLRGDSSARLDYLARMGDPASVPDGEPLLEEGPDPFRQKSGAEAD